MPSMFNVHLRILTHAEVSYKNALNFFAEGHFKRAERQAIVASGAAGFLVRDEETPSTIRKRAERLRETANTLAYHAWKEIPSDPGDKFMSGSEIDEMDMFNADVDGAMEEMQQSMVEMEAQA